MRLTEKSGWRMELTFRRVDWKFATPMRISYRTRTHAETVQVELRDGALVGRGEAQGISYNGETVDSILAQLSAASAELCRISTSEQLDTILPTGGARNAVDCALWDLRAKRSGKRIWEMLNFESVRPLVTVYTIALDAPEIMAKKALESRQYPILKIKLTGTDDLGRILCVHRARPDAKLVLDANQSWTLAQLKEMLPKLSVLPIVLIEQPLPVGHDEELRELRPGIPLCADESCQASSSLAELTGKYQFINIKLDKTGGLTEALRLANDARVKGFRLMVGCMGGSSLAMAPGFVVGQLCEVVDLDGPLLALNDVAHHISYTGAVMNQPDTRLWG